MFTLLNIYNYNVKKMEYISVTGIKSEGINKTLNKSIKGINYVNKNKGS